ncbi:hypothetical protein PJI17_31370, partial [Mycobacterium kansasii]
ETSIILAMTMITIIIALQGMDFLEDIIKDKKYINLSQRGSLAKPHPRRAKILKEQNPKRIKFSKDQALKGLTNYT